MTERSPSSRRGVGRLTKCLALAALLACSTAAAQQAGQAAQTPTMTDVVKQISALAAEVKALRAENTQLRREVDQLKAGPPAAPAPAPAPAGDPDLARLRQAAHAQMAAQPEPVLAKDTTFTAKGLGLQALNPEISLAGDVHMSYRDDHGQPNRRQSDFNFRVLDIHVESYVDPNTRFKAALGFHEGEDAELGEAYFTRYGIMPGLSATVGKFRQQFGGVNRWHKHGLDQVDHPLALRQIFGEGGLNQTGISLDWTMPRWGKHSQELVLQITDGSNDRVFGGNSLNVPSVLVRYKNYRDLSPSTYVEAGLSGLFGQNDEWTIMGDAGRRTEHDRRWTSVLGADFTMLWEPADRMRYRNVEWRSEAYLLNKSILAPDDSGSDTVKAWGAFSYIQTKLTRTLQIGVRGDFFKPDQKSYAELPGLSLAPLAVPNDDAYRWAVGPYITWEASPFLKCRLEYDHIDGQNAGARDDIVTLQFVFAVGPHKHERY